MHRCSTIELQSPYNHQSSCTILLQRSLKVPPAAKTPGRLQGLMVVCSGRSSPLEYWSSGFDSHQLPVFHIHLLLPHNIKHVWGNWGKIFISNWIWNPFRPSLCPLCCWPWFASTLHCSHSQSFLLCHTIWLLIFTGTKFCKTDPNLGFRNLFGFNFHGQWIWNPHSN